MGSEKQDSKSKKYYPEIIEAIDNDGLDTWYFALIDAEKHKSYLEAHDKGLADIKKNDEGILFVCLNGEKCGQIIEYGHGEPSEEQKAAFISEHGVPVLLDISPEKVEPDEPVMGKTPEQPATSGGPALSRRDNQPPELKP